MRTGLCGLVMTSALIAASGTSFAQTGQACDRACLLGIADAYFAALAAHDPAKAPLAPNATFTEQAQVLKVGEGLWKTTTDGPTTFKIPVPDPVSGQVGVIAMIKANVPAPAGRAGGPPVPLMQSDGSASPFAADCGRRENCMHTAGVGGPARPTPAPGITPPPGGFQIQGCAEQLDSRAMSYITSIDLRRVRIADELPKNGWSPFLR